MNKQPTNRNVLGKGMAALFGDNVQEEAPKSNNKQSFEGNQLIPINSLKPNPSQPRKIFKETELKELAQSIKENGIIQPLVASQNENGEFELISGERRLRAAKMVGLEFVPITIKKVTQKTQAILGIIENIQREDLNCVEEALSYFKLISDYKMTQEEVAKQMGKQRSSIANHLRLLKLPKKVLELLQGEQLSFGHGKVLASISDAEQINFLAFQSVEQGWSVRDLENNLKKGKSNPKSKMPDLPKFDHLEQKLEQHTGFHFNVKPKKNGAGSVVIHYNNEQELDKIYSHLMR